MFLLNQNVNLKTLGKVPANNSMLKACFSRKYVNLDTESHKAVQRADEEENKILELEEELKIVGSNLQQLEVSEEKALEREESYHKQIHELIKRFEGKLNNQ